MSTDDPWQPQAADEPDAAPLGWLAVAAIVAAAGPALRVFPHGPNAQCGAIALVVFATAATVAATRTRWGLGRVVGLSIAVAAALLVGLPRLGRAPVLIVGAATPLAVRSLAGSLPGIWPRRGSLPAAALGVPPLVIAGVLWYRTGNQAATVAVLLFAAAVIVWCDHNARRIERPLATLERWTSRIGKAAAAAILAVIAVAVVYVPGAFGSAFARRRRRQSSPWSAIQPSTRVTRRDASAPFSSVPATTRYRRLGRGLAIAAALAAIVWLLRQAAPTTPAATPAGNSPAATGDAPILFGRELAVPCSQLPAFRDVPWADELQLEEANAPDVDRRDGVHIDLRNGRLFDAECLLAAWQSGARIGEIPLRWIERSASAVRLPATIAGDLNGLVRVTPARSVGGHPTRPSPSMPHLRQLVVTATGAAAGATLARGVRPRTAAVATAFARLLAWRAGEHLRRSWSVT